MRRETAESNRDHTLRRDKGFFMNCLFLVFLAIIFLPACSGASGGGGPADRCAYSKLRLEGPRIVNEDGCDVRLRGLTLEGVIGGHGFSLWGERFEGLDLNRGYIPLEVASREQWGEDIGLVWEAWREAIAGEEDFRRIRALGFNVVRLWMDYRLFADSSLPPRWREAGFRAFERLLDHAERARVYVFFGFNGPFAESGPADCDDCSFLDRLALGSASDTLAFISDSQAQEKLLAVAAEFASRYSHRVGLFAWDLIEEPITLDLAPFDAFYRRLVETVRSNERAGRAILALQGSIIPASLQGMGDPPDDQVLYSIHWYEPWSFTNDGSHPYPGYAVIPVPPARVYYDRELMVERLSYASDFQARVQRPVFVDSGVNRLNCKWMDDGTVFDGSWSDSGWHEPCPERPPGELSAVGRWLTDAFDYHEAHGWHWSFTNYKSAGPFSGGLYYTTHRVQSRTLGDGWKEWLENLPDCATSQGARGCAEAFLASPRWKEMVESVEPDRMVKDAEKLPLLLGYLEHDG